MKTIILILITIIILGSCAIPSQVPREEDLLKINPNDRIIVGYSKNKRRYKVVDQFGRPRTDIRIDSVIYPVGKVFIAKERNCYCRY